MVVRSSVAMSPQVSKTVSFWLRHNPEDAGLTLDALGWTSIDPLLGALHKRGWSLDLESLVALNNAAEKPRWEIDRSQRRIRASHGHSKPISYEQALTPPLVLYHGTTYRNLGSIREHGLLPMGRQKVHLSENPHDARIVGSRHGSPVVIRVDAQALAADGQVFVRTADAVWLTDAVPARYLAVLARVTGDEGVADS